MVLKSLTRKSPSTRQLLSYLTEKKEKLIGDKQAPILIRHNIRSRSLDKIVKEFDHNETFRLHRRKDNVRVYHTILSFSNRDRQHINEKMLRDIAKQHMKLRGNNNMYLGVAHYDKSHVHLHLVMSGTKYLTGESNRLSRKEFHELKLAMDLYQKQRYPELIHSLPRHGRSQKLKEAQREPEPTRGNSRESQKDTLQQILEEAYAKSKSRDDFINHLKSHNHVVYFRNGRLQGVKFEGDRKFRFSRLGYDKDKLEKLDALRINEEKNLEDLRELRASRTLERDQEKEKSDQDVDRFDSEKDIDSDEEEVKNEEAPEVEEETDDTGSDDDSVEELSDEADDIYQ